MVVIIPVGHSSASYGQQRAAAVQQHQDLRNPAPSRHCLFEVHDAICVIEPRRVTHGTFVSAPVNTYDFVSGTLTTTAPAQNE
jgi:hypothetical protein